GGRGEGAVGGGEEGVRVGRGEGGVEREEPGGGGQAEEERVSRGPGPAPHAKPPRVLFGDRRFAAVLLRRPAGQERRAADPDGEVDRRAYGEERHVQVQVLVLQDLVGRNRLRPRPGIQRRREHGNRDEQQRAERKQPGP